MRSFETKPLWMPSVAMPSVGVGGANFPGQCSSPSTRRGESSTEGVAVSDGVRTIRRQAAMEKDYTIKILLLGGSGVGKSAIVRRFAGRSFDRREKPTIGIDVAVVDYGHIEDRKVRLEFWDVGSRELHGSANHHLLALRDVAGILLVADASNAASFAAVDQWRALVAKHLASREISTLLMMHRCDLLGGGAMPFDDAALTAYASAAGLCGWRWTTARTGSTVKDAVERLVEVIFASLGALDLVDRAAPYILHGRAHAATRLMEGEERGGGGGAPRPPLAACVRPPLVIVDDGDDEGDDEGDAALFPSALVQLTTTAITSEPRPGDGGDGAEDAAPMAPDADAPGAFLSAPVLVLVEHLLQTTSDYYANLAARLAVLVEARRGVALAGGDLDQLLETCEAERSTTNTALNEVADGVFDTSPSKIEASVETIRQRFVRSVAQWKYACDVLAEPLAAASNE